MSKNPLTRLLRFLFFAVVVRAVILSRSILRCGIASGCLKMGLPSLPAITIPISMRWR